MLPVTKMDDCFTICQHKTEKPTNIEISTSISLEVWLFWCGTDMFSIDPKWLLSKVIIKSTGLKMWSHGLRYFNFADTISQLSLDFI